MSDLVITSGEPKVPVTAPTVVESKRAIAEIQGAIFVAKEFPRDQVIATERIVQAFTRPSLALAAKYSYPRGDTAVEGPSIRAAEAMAQNWGNFQCGVRELEQRYGESTVEAFAWDVETNTRDSRTFTVKHQRTSGKRTYNLEDPRDIYEMVANQAARRKRACILALIPGDVVEAAMAQAEITLQNKAQITDEYLKKTLEAFASISVTRDMLEGRIQRRFETLTPALAVQLNKIFNSIRDGFSGIADWFEVPQVQKNGDEASTADRIAATLGASDAPAAPVDEATATVAPAQQTERRSRQRTPVKSQANLLDEEDGA